MKKKTVALFLTAVLICMALIGCGNSNSTSSTKTDMASFIDEISLFGIENNVAYWDVYLSDDVEWGQDDSFMTDLALYSIKECVSSQENKNADSWSVMGYEADGNLAFSWGGINGITEMRFYELSAHTHNQTLTDSQLKDLGIESAAKFDESSDSTASSQNNSSDNVSSDAEDVETVKSQLDIKAIPTSDNAMCVFITNNSNTVIDELGIQINYKDESGTTIDTYEDGHDMILPDSTVVSRLDAPASYSDYEIIPSIELGIYPNYENHANDVQISSNPGNDCVIIEITNNSSVSIDEIEYIVVFYKNDQVATVTYPEDVRDVSSGQTVTEKQETYGIEYDSFNVYLNQAHTFGL